MIPQWLGGYYFYYPLLSNAVNMETTHVCGRQKEFQKLRVSLTTGLILSKENGPVRSGLRGRLERHICKWGNFQTQGCSYGKRWSRIRERLARTADRERVEKVRMPQHGKGVYLQSQSCQERVKCLVTVMSMGREPIRNHGKCWQQVFVRTGVFESDSLTPQWGFGGRKGHGSVWEESTRDEESLAVCSLSTLPSTLSVKVSSSTPCKWPLSRSRNERKRSGAKEVRSSQGLALHELVIRQTKVYWAALLVAAS